MFRKLNLKSDGRRLEPPTMVDKLIDCALHIVLGWYIDFLPETF